MRMNVYPGLSTEEDTRSNRALGLSPKVRRGISLTTLLLGSYLTMGNTKCGSSGSNSTNSVGPKPAVSAPVLPHTEVSEASCTIQPEYNGGDNYTFHVTARTTGKAALSYVVLRADSDRKDDLSAPVAPGTTYAPIAFEYGYDPSWHGKSVTPTGLIDATTPRGLEFQRSCSIPQLQLVVGEPVK